MAGARLEGLSESDPAALGTNRLLGRLASGGMGRIYLAQAADGQLVAVKTLLAEGEVSDIDRRRFAREVKLAQRIDSAFTARVREADPDAEQPWMAIDYIAAPALSELVRAAGVLPASAVRWLAAGTAEALVTLHRESIIHRDVKPQNILLPLTGPRLIDFGISHASDLTRTSLTLGTIAFTSPEQARGETSTAASDVYSLGATLFHLTTGRPPYRADGDTLALLARVQRGELDLDGLPKELVPLIRPCLAVHPADRPAPADVLHQFRQAMAGLPLSQSGSRWLPPRWTALIEVYERQSHALRRGAAAGPDDLTVDQRTSAVPRPGRTQMYTRDAEAEAEAEAVRARAQREREQEREKEQERERAAREHERAERERAEKQAVREQAARLKAERAAEQRRAEERRQERARKRASSSSAQQPPLSVASVTAPPAKKGSSSGWWLIPLIFFVMVVWRPWESDTASSSGGSSSSSSSGYTSSSGSSSGSSSSGTVADPDPTPDAADAAFRAVSTGDCLTAYDDGYDDWSTTVPRRVSCGAADAYTRVTSARKGISFADCPTGNGRSYWYHAGSVSDFTASLCLERQFRTGQCFVAKVSNTSVTKSLLMNVWSCDASKVPSGYNATLQITGYHRAQKSYPRGYCARSQGDRNSYWIYDVDGGKNVLCTTQTD
ncbi:serine/threonine protein kinase [Streptomyces sp. NBC_01724]|uniref:serine/threonine-protein kinase n=1 Tax=unclassified Streptomyces TaxID=2593676 RepID=UPI0028C40178|nr:MULTISPECIES: serine/threonine-protein kinase [unclassified Streptomyces]WNO66793.1 serine/threonine-protein kinase [Streptomyces sp. AM2-3-1]WTE61802.1 serine/threonine protein kinase [Streptomyces sp. NBC_01617]